MTIVAENSIMRAVLAAVQACLGVPMDVPNGVANDRSYLHLGPAAAHEVMDALLSSTELDYVIQSSNVAPDKIQKILLFARTDDSRDPKAASLAANHEMTPARRAWMAMRENGRAPVEQPRAEDEPNKEEDPKESSDTPAPAKQVGADAPSGSSEKASTDQPAPADTNAVKDTGEAPPQGVPAATPPTEAAPPGTNQDSSGDKELQNKINEMQQLFDQRKKMNSTPGTAPNPN